MYTANIACQWFVPFHMKPFRRVSSRLEAKCFGSFVCEGIPAPFNMFSHLFFKLFINTSCLFWLCPAPTIILEMASCHFLGYSYFSLLLYLLRSKSDLYNLRSGLSGEEGEGYGRCGKGLRERQVEERERRNWGGEDRERHSKYFYHRRRCKGAIVVGGKVLLGELLLLLLLVRSIPSIYLNFYLTIYLPN